MKTLTKVLAAASLFLALALTSCEPTIDLGDLADIENENRNNDRNDDNNNDGSNDNNNDNDSGNGDKDNGDADKGNVPVINGLSYIRQESCNGGVMKIYKNSTDNYHNTIEKYMDALENAGYQRVGSSNGGGWGQYGGRQAWGYKGSRYVKVNAQVQDNGSYVYVCVWENGRPNDDDCQCDD